MAKDRIDIKARLEEYRQSFGLRQKIFCSIKENKEYLKLVKSGGSLPDGIYRSVWESGMESDEFYMVDEPELTEAQLHEYLTYKQLDMIRTIKNCVVFFTTITVIGMVLAFLAFIGEMM